MSAHGGLRAVSGEDASSRYLHGGNGDVMKGGTAMMEILTEMQKLLEANEKLQTALQTNSRVMEQKVQHVEKLKKELGDTKVELSDLKQRYGDTRVSVLGFKARLMKMNGEMKQLRDPNAFSSSSNTDSTHQLERRLEQMSLEKEQKISSLQKTVSDLTQQLQQCSTQTQGWSIRSENWAREKEQMQSQYVLLLQQKDVEIAQLQQSIENKKRDLIEKQGTIDSLHHRPIPKPRMAVPDPQMAKELQVTKKELLETQQELQERTRQLTEVQDTLSKERKHRETGEQRTRELRTKLESMSIEANVSKTSRPDARLTSENEIARLTSERSQLNDQIEALKRELYDARSNGQNKEQELSQLRSNYDRVVREGENAERRLQLDLREANDAKLVLKKAKESIEQENVRLRREAEQRPKDEGMAIPGQSRHAKAKRLLEEKHKLEDQLNALKSKYEDVEEDLNMKDRELIGMKQEYEGLQIQIAEERDQMETQSKLQENQIQRMESTSAELNRKLYIAESQLETARNKDEHIHALERQLAEAEKTLRKKDRSRLGWTEVMTEMQAEIKRLTEKHHEINKEKMHFQSLVTQLQQEVAFVNQELDKSKKRVEKKQQDCQEHLDTSKAWRAQFEQAKKDFDDERRQREHDAQSVSMFKKKIVQMEEDITKLHQKSNVSEQHIATLEDKLQENDILLPLMPGDNVFTGELRRVPKCTTDPPGNDGGHNWAGSPGGRPMNWQGGGGGGGRMDWQSSHGGGDWQGGHGGGDWQGGRGGGDWQGGRGGGMEHIDRGMDHQFQQPPMDYSGQTNRTESHILRSAVPRVNNQQMYAATQLNPQPPPPQHSHFVAPGEVQNLAKPAMDCPICGRKDFKTQTELEVHSAQCT